MNLEATEILKDVEATVVLPAPDGPVMMAMGMAPGT
jgi:hypothetical protein